MDQVNEMKQEMKDKYDMLVKTIDTEQCETQTKYQKIQDQSKTYDQAQVKLEQNQIALLGQIDAERSNRESCINEKVNNMKEEVKDKYDMLVKKIFFIP